MSSRSLLEQGVCEGDLLQLRFKYYSFYELDEKVSLTWSALSLSLFCYSPGLIALSRTPTPTSAPVAVTLRRSSDRRLARAQCTRTGGGATSPSTPSSVLYY